MSTATRTAGPTGSAAVRADAGAVAVDSPAPPVVVIDLPRVAQRLRELRASLPWMDVRYDVSALSHPVLLRALTAEGIGFVVSHDAALAPLRAVGADLARALHAVPDARAPRRRDAWRAGVRSFVVDDPRGLDGFACAPAGISVLLRLDPGVAVEAASSAAALGVQVAGLSLRVPPGVARDDLLDAVEDAVAAGARVAAATGRRLDVLDLGEALTGAAAGRPEHLAALGRSIRALVAPATTGTAVIASAGNAVAADAITIVAGSEERYADTATASAYIDAGAEVLVLRRRRRLLRPERARSTPSPAG